MKSCVFEIVLMLLHCSLVHTAVSNLCVLCFFSSTNSVHQNPTKLQLLAGEREGLASGVNDQVSKIKNVTLEFIHCPG